MSASESDLARWHEIATRVHSRHSDEQPSLYVKLLSIVERFGHRRIAEISNDARRILEVGIGGGEHLHFTGRSTRNYTGLEIDPDFARITREKFGIEVAVADAADMPFADSSFDCVLAIAILEHVARIDDVLAEIHRVLEANGKLIVLVPTNGSILINAFKRLMTYPTMRKAGIENPELVWNHLNINDLPQVRSALMRRFSIEKQTSTPIPFLPWRLSPLWIFQCSKADR